MSLWNKLKNELIDIIEWLSDDRSIMAHRFERYNNEIKNGAKLVVREGQVAVFINEGAIADVFVPGTYTLTTQNLPILATLKGWKYGFESPFKAEVIFVRTTQYTDQKWGTKNPIMLRCPEFGPVRLRAFGTYAFSVKAENAGNFIKEIVGTDSSFSNDEVISQLRNIIVSRFTDKLGELKVPVLDMAANYDELGEIILEKIGPEFIDYGIDLRKFLVENIALPPEVEKALDKRTSMGVLGDLNKYTQYQTAEAIPIAAGNSSGGMAAEGMGLGVGFAMAGNMMNSMNAGFGGQPQQQQAAPQAPPAPGGTPPPPPTATQNSYHLSANGESYGPYTVAQLQAFIPTGQFAAESVVWTQGMAAWLPAAQVGELAALFGPPPAPGAGQDAGPPPPPPM